MKRFFPVLLCVILLLSAAGAEGNIAFQSDPDTIADALQSVVMLEIRNREDECLTRASGFAAFAEGILVTSSHVLSNMHHMTAVTEDGRRIAVERVLAVDTQADVALCLLPADAGLPVLECREELPPRGEPVTAVGSALGILNMVASGNISAHWENAGVTWLLFTAPIFPGFSGGPLFDSAGRVTGVIAGTYEGAGSVSLAAPASAAFALWQRTLEE